MDRYVNPAGAVFWSHDLTAEVPDGFEFDRNVPDGEIEATLSQYRCYTVMSGRAFAIGSADQDPTPLAELGFKQWAPHVATGWGAYSRDRGEAPGQPGFADEWDWEIGPSAVSPLIRRVANRQAEARKAAA